MIASRRKFLTGLSTLIAAPAIIKVASIMPVKVMELDNARLFFQEWSARVAEVYSQAWCDQIVFGTGCVRQTEEFPFIECVSPALFLEPAKEI